MGTRTASRRYWRCSTRKSSVAGAEIVLENRLLKNSVTVSTLEEDGAGRSATMEARETGRERVYLLDRFPGPKARGSTKTPRGSGRSDGS